MTKEVDAYLVVMEGHVRLTAYLIAPEYIPAQLEVILEKQSIALRREDLGN